jgi:hypothetical protein
MFPADLVPEITIEQGSVVRTRRWYLTGFVVLFGVLTLFAPVESGPSPSIKFFRAIKD